MGGLAREGVSRAAVIAAFATVYLVWGSTYLAIRVAIETLPGFLMAGTRFLIAGGLLYGWTQLRGEARPVGVEWRSVAIVGGLLLLGGNGLVVWAEQWVPSGVAALLVATVPFWMVLLEWLRGGERPGLGIGLGLVLGFAGIAVLAGPGEWAGGAIDTVGALALLGASLSWAVGSIYSRGAPLPKSPLVSTAGQMLAGGVLLLIVGVATGELSTFDPAAVSWRSIGAVLYLIVFGSLIGFTAYVWLLQVASPAKVSTYAYVNPVVAVLLGWAIVGEPLTARVGIAVAVIVGAVVAITRRRRASAPATPKAPVDENAGASAVAAASKPIAHSARAGAGHGGSGSPNRRRRR